MINLFNIVALGLTAMIILFILYREGFMKKRSILIISCVLTLVTIVARAIPIDNRSGDYNTFLQHWVQFFRDNEGFKALGTPIGDYNFPYLYFLALFSYIPVNDLYLIKLLSIAFDIALAYYAMRLCGLVTVNSTRRLATFFLVLLLPTVVINSSWWAQCDSIYAAFTLGALYYGLKRRGVLAMFFAVLAFAFKLQAVFVLPIFAVLLMSSHIKWRHLPFFPLFYGIIILPALLMGRPITDAITIYFNQTSTYSTYLTLNAPTFFAYFPIRENVDVMTKLGVALAFIYLIALFVIAFKRRKQLNSQTILMLAFAMSVGVPFFLPSMHERYFYLAEVLSVTLAVSGLTLFVIPIAVQAACLICYSMYMRRAVTIPLPVPASIIAACLVFIFANTLTKLRMNKYGNS